ncbi:MAG: OmpP1/FadL family transporter, partial [Gemmatimonadota bacterium]
MLDQATMDLRFSPIRRLIGSFVALITLLPASIVLLFPDTAFAQGFGVYEHGTCAMGRAAATVAEPCDDGSAVFYNPAGLADAEGVTVTGGATLVASFGEFTSDTGESWDLQSDPIPVPHAFATVGMAGDVGLGLGVFVPYALETVWPTGDFPGRYMGYDNGLETIYVQPTVAWSPAPWISVGGGVDVVFGTVKLNQRLDLAQQEIVGGITGGMLGIPFHTEFADVGLESDVGTGLGGHLGVRIEPTDRVTLGLRYMSQVEVDYGGDAEFTQLPTDLVVPADLSLGPTTIPAGTPIDALLASEFEEGEALGDQSVSTSITMPDQVVVGVAYRPTDRLLLEADWQWVNWEDFDRLVIEFENAPEEVRVEEFENTGGIRLGAEYDLREDIALRGGYTFA